MQIKLLVEGGEMKPGPTLSQKLGPAGINMGQVISKINQETVHFKGLKVPVELDVNVSDKTFEVKVFSPPVSGLLKKELGLTKGSGMQGKVKVGNASIEQIISVAKKKMNNMLCKDLKSAVKTVVGTCVSLGVLVENKPATEVELEIDEGKYDKEINSGKTEASEEKTKQLNEFYAKIKSEQDKLMKQELAAKEAEEAAKVAAATPAAGATPAAAATPAATTAAKPAAKAPAKAAAKPAKK